MRSLFEIACKRCNSNDGNSAFEAVVGELRATLLRRGGGVARVRIPHHARGRIRQNVDSFSHNRLSSPFFTQWVCTLVATPPQTTPAPPPIGGIALHGGSTRRRHAVRGLRVVQNPHRHQPEVRRVASKTGAGPLGAKNFAQHRPSSGISAKKFARHAQKGRIWANLSVQGELFRAFTI